MTAFCFSLRQTRSNVLGALVLVALVLPSAPALAQGSDMQILLDRMERLERDIRTLNRQIARGPSAAPIEASGGSTGASAPASIPSAVQFTEGEGALSRVTVRLSALEREVRQATGQTEGLSYRIDQISMRLDKLIVDLDYRLARLEGRAPGNVSGGLSAEPSISAVPSSPSVSKVGEMAAPTATATGGPLDGGTISENGTYMPPQSGGGTLGRVSKTTVDQFVPLPNTGEQEQAALAAPSPTTPTETAPVPSTASSPALASSSVLPAGTPRERYQFAFGLMSQARYGEAEVALKEFIAAHGDDPLAGNARYWLGEAYYVRKSFMDAAQTFFQAYKSTPNGPKAPDSLLKLGMSMASLDKTEEACATFGKLRKEFAELKPGIEKTLNRETTRLKCQ